jgi:hypothetical protein
MTSPALRHRRRETSTPSSHHYLFVLILILAMELAVIRKAAGEDRLDFKYMYYQEEDDRIQVLSPAILMEKDLSSTMTLKVEGIYNAISGASPTGAPIQPGRVQTVVVETQPYSVYVEDARENEGRRGDDFEVDDEDEDDDDDEREFENERGDRERSGLKGRTLRLRPVRPSRWYAKAGATPTPSPAPARPAASGGSSGGTVSQQRTVVTTNSVPVLSDEAARIPMADVDDERTAVNIELSKKLDRHTVAGVFSYSTESDYDSLGLALRDSIDFNQKNTTLNLGAAVTHDEVEAFARGTTENKDSVDLMVGVTQVLSPRTLFTVNLTLGVVEGFLDDQYKIVSVNDILVPESRPDNKDKQVVLLSLNHFFDAVQGGAEVSYRYYDDSFGIRADTFTLSWFQKAGRRLVINPMIRYYDQSEADFYGISFTGNPQYYSSDYRVSALQAVGYGLRFIWTPNQRCSFDLGYERYEQEGTDGVTPDAVYPSANIVTAGARWWF